ncbi:MAG: lytic transglycosylase domain-containing protein [Candidatus Cloacimonetes bacterium]|jgi:soluble lytic murein transglycosylase|nr:lytic transglycosylase domain-containing protein [Candidatus Cloacimonadota bacterium]
MRQVLKKKLGKKAGRTALLVLLLAVFLSYNPISARIFTVSVAIYHKLDPVVFYRLIRTESSFRSFAVSRKAALGLGQIKEDTALYIHPNHKRGLLFYPLYNLDMAARYLHYLKSKYHDNWSLSLAAYNWGETNVNKRLSGMEIDPKYNYRELFRDIPETYEYIGKILN